MSLLKQATLSQRPMNTQIALGIHLVRSESSLCVRFDAYGPYFIHAHDEDSDQSGRIAYTELSLTSHKSFSLGVFIVCTGLRIE